MLGARCPWGVLRLPRRVGERDLGAVLVYGWKGIFPIWSIDHRWTVRQAVMAMPARDQNQREL